MMKEEGKKVERVTNDACRSEEGKISQRSSHHSTRVCVCVCAQGYRHAA